MPEKISGFREEGAMGDHALNLSVTDYFLKLEINFSVTFG